MGIKQAKLLKRITWLLHSLYQMEKICKDTSYLLYVVFLVSNITQQAIHTQDRQLTASLRRCILESFYSDTFSLRFY